MMTASPNYAKRCPAIPLPTMHACTEIMFLSNSNSMSLALVNQHFLLGCGTGNYAIALSPYVGKITGVEYNKGMMEQARKKTEDLPHVTILEGNALNIPLPDKCCDVAICTQVSCSSKGYSA